mmetsp:Transcript_7203/g.14847  ORF Transcript_7203/g.14847 Transcript_7203/m.14847 type:complete len:93 (-) Transcript_7203:169-447(-)
MTPIFHSNITLFYCDEFEGGLRYEHQCLHCIASHAVVLMCLAIRVFCRDDYFLCSATLQLEENVRDLKLYLMVLLLFHSFDLHHSHHLSLQH